MPSCAQRGGTRVQEMGLSTPSLPASITPSAQVTCWLVPQNPRWYIKRVRKHSKTIPILIKSTTDIQTLRDINEKNITFSPEFLVAANANEDFANQDFAVFGGNNGRFWYNVFKGVCNIKTVRFTDIVTAG